MQFQTQYNHVKSLPEKNLGEELVETAGYFPANQRIENMILAGQRLIDYRSQFDFEVDEEIDEDYSDPTRRKDYDFADASQESYRIEQNLKVQKAFKTKKKAAQPAPKAQNEPQNEPIE